MFRKAAALIQEDKYASKITKSVMEETGSIPSWAKYVNVDISAGSLLEACDMAYAVKGEILPSESVLEFRIQLSRTELILPAL